LEELKGLTSPNNPARIIAGSYDVHTNLEDPPGDLANEEGLLVHNIIYCECL